MVEGQSLDHTSMETKIQQGYGRWDAPYWFIGPEPGQARDEHNDLQRRFEAWLHLGGGELNDCRDFHALIGEKRWHRERPQLQPTWRPLILLLMAFLERPTDKESLRNYRAGAWRPLPRRARPRQGAMDRAGTQEQRKW